jgi:hypothetical protein
VLNDGDCTGVSLGSGSIGGKLGSGSSGGKMVSSGDRANGGSATLKRDFSRNFSHSHRKNLHMAATILLGDSTVLNRNRADHSDIAEHNKNTEGEGTHGSVSGSPRSLASGKQKT